jgi:hypothetical protein
VIGRVNHFVVLAAASCAACGKAAPERAEDPHYLFYLHGRIVEDQGQQGISPAHGRYDYPGILTAFRQRGFEVVSEARPRGTDVELYAGRVAREVEALIARGVDPSHITVVGASKGAVIAALASTRLRRPGLRYVLLANCNDWLIRTHDPRLTGEVLSIYESSDDVGGSCRPLAQRSPDLGRFAEVRLETGLGHGMVYRPLDAWVGPAAEWAQRQERFPLSRE